LEKEIIGCTIAVGPLQGIVDIDDEDKAEDDPYSSSSLIIISSL